MQFAERELALKRADGTSQPVLVRLYAPEDRGERGWESDIEILGPGDEVSRSHGDGIDAFQALEGALVVLHAMLGRYSLMGELYFCDEPGHGLPFMRRIPEKLDIIAERTLTFSPPSGDARRVTVFLGRPYWRGPQVVWFVHLNILDKEKMWRFPEAEGRDPIDALVAGLRTLDTSLDWYRKRGELTGKEILGDSCPMVETDQRVHHGPRKKALLDVVEAGRRLGAAVANAARVFVCR